MRLIVFLAAFSFLHLTGSASAENVAPNDTRPPQLSLPIDCEPSKSCFIQNYVDIDKGPGMRDYSCGKAGYDGHKGVDIRVVSRADMAKGVKVLAAAPGRVVGVRDGIADRLVRTASDRAKLKGKDCGNGVSIAHGGGLRTQYCHMRRGSLKVKVGDMVERGQSLGLVGLSGRTTFPHLHISTWLKGKIISPFTGHPADAGCEIADKRPLWTKDVLAAFPYRDGEIIKTGFASQKVSLENLRAGKPYPPPRSKDAPALVLYGWAINLRQGDILKLTIDGPEGPVTSHSSQALPRRKAEYFQFAGKKRPQGGWPQGGWPQGSWPQGTYHGRVEIIRNGKIAITSLAELEIR